MEGTCVVPNSCCFGCSSRAAGSCGPADQVAVYALNEYLEDGQNDEQIDAELREAVSNPAGLIVVVLGNIADHYGARLLPLGAGWARGTCGSLAVWGQGFETLSSTWNFF